MVQNRGQGTAAALFWGPWKSDAQVEIGKWGLQSESEVKGGGDYSPD